MKEERPERNRESKIASMRGRESGVELEIRNGDEMESEVLAYLITITRLTEVHGLWVGDGPYTIAISTIDLS